MVIREVRENEKNVYNKLVSHPVQTWEWGEFKKKTGAQIVRLGAFSGQQMVGAYTLSFHSLPKLSYSVGYFPKGPLPDVKMLRALSGAGQKKRAIFIKLEPNVSKEEGRTTVEKLSETFNLRKSKSVFTPHTFQINLIKNDDELLAAMKAKTRYNVRIAQRNGVTVSVDNSTFAFETYLRLTRQTARRQRFYAHDEDYHRKMWEILHQADIAHLLVARWKDKILTTWIVFIWENIIYYPYGASSDEDRNLMASNLMMWEAMRFGKKMGCHTFDLWGSLGLDPNSKDPWYGFHRFKEGYGGKLTEFVGTYDLILLPQLYSIFLTLDNVRWKWLRLMAKFR